MPTLAEYFDSESRSYVGQLRELAGATRPEPAALHRAARALRGTAQIAREERAYRAALALEAAGRSIVDGGLEWTEELHEAVRAAVADLDAMVTREETDSALDDRLAASLERWSARGVSLPAAALGEPAAPAPAGSTTAELRAWAAREVESIAEALEQGVTELSSDAMNRQALKAILRRQRALLGAARLDEIPVVAEILRAIEDMTRVIAKLDVGVKQEWLDVFRVARDGLASAVEPLRADRDPAATHSLARLRHLRAELLERYGAGETVSAAGESPELEQALPASSHAPPLAGNGATMTAAAPPGSGPGLPGAEPASGPPPAPTGAAPAARPEPVPIDQLQYRGEAALARALELRAPLEAALRGRPAHLEVLDELYDLLRLARD